MSRRLVSRLGLMILAVNGAAIAVVFAALFAFGWLSGLSGVRRTADSIVDGGAPGLLEAAWDLSDRRIEQQLERLLSLPHVAWARLSFSGRSLEAGDSAAATLETVDFELTHPVGGPIGRLEVGFSRESVRASVHDSVGRLVLPVLVLFLTLGVTLTFALRMMVTRHLDALARHARSLGVDTLDRDFAFARPPRGDELDNLLDAIREMRSNLGREIEGRRRAEADLAQTEELRREIFNATTDAIFLHEEDGRVIDVNETATEMYGCARELLLEGGVERFSVNEEPWTPRRAGERLAAAAAGEPQLFEWKARRADGSPFWCEVGLRPLRVEDRLLVIASVRDVSARKEMESQLHHARRLDAVGQLAGGVAHDFNNMLAGILGSAELLRFELAGAPAERLELVDLIVQSAQRAAGLTRKLLDFSRKGVAESSVVDVHEAIEGAAAILQRSLDKRVRLELALAAPEHRVRGDLSALQNAILNLGINAGHAMPEGGELTLSTSLVQAPGAGADAPPALEIRVADTGCGIPEDLREKIFEPFFTTRAPGQGTGLGLAAVYGTVSAHGGRLRVESGVGRGTTFFISLPLCRDEEDRRDAAPAPVVEGRGCVLVVDDEATVRTMAVRLLRNLGYETLEAGDGVEALSVYRRAQGAVDLVLLDMVMPEMDGRECFEELRRLDPAVRVVLSTGYPREADLGDLKRDGLAGVLQKPWRVADLGRAVAEALGRSER